ncbi:unnamed protein product [Rotaria magnacalcarata]|nr:unnamed protein product [Rotaria magnacalcarata]CAF5204813.1 unnamed protein product [Rotaria magnacalcarata]CAF5205713.1 unnamed protein product [Rotaria magnacalcarata]
MPFVPMTGTYILPQGPTTPHHPQLPPSFYPTFYAQSPTHHPNGPLINGHAYVPSPYLYSMGPPPVPAQYQAMNDISMTSEY